MDKSKIKKVHVVFKTHLDIGFTDMGATVLERYRKEYIPHSIDLAFQMNTEKDKKFIWTVGSFLIDDFFKNCDKESCEKLREAIRRGDICWHGLACTTHTELLDEELFHFDLSISDRLDAQFGKKTIATKMTDVPGHTKAIVKMLAEHGKQYLHIGVNPSSMVPEVPTTFLWKSEGKEIVVQYSFQYGSPCYVEGMDEALEFAHTGDNLGPQSAEAIQEEMDRIQSMYPNATIVASTMDAYAESVWKIKDTLPVIEEEIGDTWIHGIASDPLKVARYRELVRLKNIWKESGKIQENSEEYKEFLLNLMMIAEHTWGLDYKKYLMDFDHWEKADFQEARKKDATTFEMLTNRNANMVGVLTSDIHKYRNDDFTGSYAFYESSHKEQMEYIFKAIRALPMQLQAEAEAAISKLEKHEKKEESRARQLAPYEHVTIGSYEAAFGGNGEIVYLAKEGKEWITEGQFGKLGYTTYNARDCVDNYYSYNRDFRSNQCWSEGDFSKPGLEFVEGLQHKEYEFAAMKILLEGEKVDIILRGNQKAAETYGCPRNAQISYTFGDKITCRVEFTDKDANRMPEAIWLDMKFDVENPYRWKMNKMGQYISPLDVARGGNRKQHCVEEMLYTGADGTISVKNIHAPLISVGGRWLYGEYRELPQVENGFSYCLFNNKWGTNFKMWCEDDCAFEFEIAF
ncbi:MAG: DUF5054 domain-containing protein [Acetatifactor sp.]|nr:DUF5054 domain-containing protein [Acetatifactor sp.]